MDDEQNSGRAFEDDVDALLNGEEDEEEENDEEEDECSGSDS